MCQCAVLCSKYLLSCPCVCGCSRFGSSHDCYIARNRTGRMNDAPNTILKNTSSWAVTVCSLDHFQLIQFFQKYKEEEKSCSYFVQQAIDGQWYKTRHALISAFVPLKISVLFLFWFGKIQITRCHTFCSAAQRSMQVTNIIAVRRIIKYIRFLVFALLLYFFGARVTHVPFESTAYISATSISDLCDFCASSSFRFNDVKLIITSRQSGRYCGRDRRYVVTSPMLLRMF